MTNAILEQGFAAQTEALREFGYSDVTVGMVRDAHAKWMAGEAPIDIVARFCESAFEDHPAIFGTRSQ